MPLLRGLALKLTALLLFTIMAALVKEVSKEIPTGQVIFFRSIFALPVVFAWVAMKGELRGGLKAQKPMGHVWRGVIGVSAMACNFVALGILPLPEVTAIGFTAPLMTVLLAALLLGERLRAFRMTAVVIGFVGVLVVLWPRLGGDAHLGNAALIGVGFVLASAALRSLVQIHVRRMVATESTAAIVFYFTLTSSTLGLLSLPFAWETPDLRTLIYLILTGIIGGMAQILMTAAYRFAQASVLASFDYVAILYSIAVGMMFFNEVPTLPMIIGSTIVVGSGLMIVWRERKLGLERGKARPTLTPNG